MYNKTLFKYFREQYETAKRKFVEVAAKNPDSAIRWDAEEVIEGQFICGEIDRIEEYLDTSKDFSKDLNGLIEEITNKLTGDYYGSGSTSLFHNAVMQTEPEAAKKVLSVLKSIKSSYERELEKVA